MARDEKTHLDKAMEVVVYGPVGAALYVKDALPPFFRLFIMRGKNEIDSRQHRLEEQVKQLKGMGQLAVAFGVPKAKETANQSLADLRTRGETLLEKAAGVAQGAATVAATNAARAPRPAATRPPAPGAPTLVPDADDTVSEADAVDQVVDEIDIEIAEIDVEIVVVDGLADSAAVESNGVESNGSGAAAATAPKATTPRVTAPRATAPAKAADTAAHALPIEGYNELSASQVVERLTGLSPEDLRAVREYETAGRGRKTILGKIEQLGA